MRRLLAVFLVLFFVTPVGAATFYINDDCESQEAGSNEVDSTYWQQQETADDRISTSDTVARDGTRSYKFERKQDGENSDDYVASGRRAEVNNGTKIWHPNGTEVWIAFSTYFPSSETYRLTAGMNFYQPHKTSSPVLPHGNIQIDENARIQIIHRWNEGANSADIVLDSTFDASDKDVWIDWVIHQKCTDNIANDIVEIWRDGAELISYGNPGDVAGSGDEGTIQCGSSSVSFSNKAGYYHAEPTDAFILYHDEFRAATAANGGSYATVAPIIRPNVPTFDASCDAAQCIDAGETGVDASQNQTAEVDDTGYTETHTDGQNVFSHKWSDWQLCSSSNCDAGRDPIQSSYDDAANLTKWVITSGNIANNNTYYVRCRFASWAGDVDRDGDGTTAASDTDDIYDGEWAVMSFTTGGVSDTPVNNSPVLNPIGAKSVDAGQLLQFTVKATDPDGDTLTYSASNLPAGATFDFSTQIFRWIPNYVIASNHTVTFKVSDDGTPPLNDSETVTITVREVNITLPSTHLRINLR